MYTDGCISPSLTVDVSPNEVNAMVSVTDALLKDISEKIVATVHPRMIILFGSHARGTARPDSDLDFIVVEDGPFGPERSRRAETVKLWRLLRDVRVAKDFLVFTPEEARFAEPCCVPCVAGRSGNV